MATTQPSLTGVVLHGVGGRMFLALWGGMVTVIVCRALGFTVWLTATAVVVLAAACSLGQRALPALVIAVTGWLVVDGFAVHSHGQLGASISLFWVLVGTIAASLTTSTITRKAAR
jgi:hypothetical protein